jgi:hypothetical protein
LGFPEYGGFPEDERARAFDSVILLTVRIQARILHSCLEKALEINSLVCLISGFVMHNRLLVVCAVCTLFIIGCSPPITSGSKQQILSDSPPGFQEQNVVVSPETLKPYTALFSVDRQKMGFPPLPTNGTVRILTVDRDGWKLEYAPPNYDVSFQFYQGSSFYPYTQRFIALKRSTNGYNVVSEQMTYSGPKRYAVSETMANESISIVNETEQVAFTGTNITGTVITYSGPDPRFKSGPFASPGLSPADIGPVLREWGYDYRVDVTQQGAAAVGNQLTPLETNSTSSAAGSRR